MKIALLGYGKMGQIIEHFATERGHKIILKITSGNLGELTKAGLQQADIAIDFSTPGTVVNNIYACFEANLPIVVGTTGWYGQLQEVKTVCLNSNKSILYGSNFSVGVNIFFHINKILAKVMNNYPVYEVQIEEIHHTEKLDAPSGTAITIAEEIINRLNRKNEWVNEPADTSSPKKLNSEQLLIESHRIQQVPGTHTVIYSSEIDDIEIKHTAHNRDGFALGAIMAAEWLNNKQGFYNITEVFNF